LEALAEPSLTLDITIPDQSAVMATLEDAIAGGSVVEMEYASGQADLIERRRIQPRTSFSVDGLVYVHAWCFRADDVRTFRTDRIVGVEPAPDHPPPSTPAGEGPPALRRDPDNMSAALLHIAPEALWIVDSEPVVQVPDASAEPAGDGSKDGVYAEIRYASVDWLVRWVMGHGGAVSVVEPEEVRGLVRQAAVARQHSG
jgi:proteasome accessory factor C